MIDGTSAGQTPAGIPGLPKGWAIAVQLFGTFGLAVFLVLWYIIVLQPREAARFDQLRSSVDELMEVVDYQYTLVNRGQEERLSDLHPLAVANELADIVLDVIEAGTSPDELAGNVERTMMIRTELLPELKRKDGGVNSEILVHKVRNIDTASRLAAIIDRDHE